jgi:hypothetical protein
MPLLTEVGIEFSGEPEIFEVHNIVKRQVWRASTTMDRLLMEGRGQ